MNRQEMLNRLHSLPVRVKITYLPSEEALECQYVTSKGSKEEWIGLGDWPASLHKDSNGDTTYILRLNGEDHSFNNYQSFADFFEQNWIGKVHLWEDCDDDTLGEMLDWINEFDEGIPFEV